MSEKLVHSLAITAIFILLYSYKLGGSFTWDSDWSRDLYETAKLASGDITLIGPALTGAVFAGPYYYYSLAPQLILSGYNEIIILYANAIVFALAIGILCYRHGTWTALMVGLAPFWIIAARHPGNAYSYLPILAILLITVKYKKNKVTVRQQLLWGFLAGVIANYHPASLIIILPICLMILVRSKSWWWALGIAATYIPLLLFEYKHDWVMTQAVLTGKFMLLVQSKTSEAMQTHYLLPILLAITVSLAIFFKNRLVVIAKLMLVILLVAVFPYGAYQTRGVDSSVYEEAVNEVINSKMINQHIPFNILGINDEKKQVVSANEFRYFLWKKGYRPLEITNYAQAETLIVFSKLSIDDPKKVSTWEITQFSDEPVITQEAITSEYLIYKLSKI